MHPRKAGEQSVREFQRDVNGFYRNTTSYKCIGNEDSKNSFASILQAVSVENYSFPNRQYNSLVLSCEDGGTKNKYLIELAKEIWKYLLHHGITITAENLSSSMNVEADWQSRNSNLSDQGKIRNESFYFLTVSATSTVHCMETRSIQSGNRCNTTYLVQSIPLCFPTFFIDKQGLKKDSPGPRWQVAVSCMVRNPFENVNRETTSFTTPPTSSIKPPGSDSSINNKKNLIKIGSLDSFKQRPLAISEAHSKLISSTRRQVSLPNYNSPWSKCVSWCCVKKN